MKKFIILSIFSLAFLQMSNAQLYTVQPNDTSESVLPPNEYTGEYIYLRNINADTLQFAWTKVYESIPAGWDYSLCDLGTCYPGYPAGGTMALVMPADSAFMAAHANPFSLSGTLVVRFYVYEVSAPAQGDTLTWILHAQTTGIEDVATANLGLYPNPTVDYIQVNTTNMEYPAMATVYDLNGKSVLKTNIMQQNQTIDVLSLSAGTYILEVQNKNIVRSTFIKQ